MGHKKFDPFILEKLMEEASEKAGTTLAHADLRDLAEKLNEEGNSESFSQKYLYKTLLKIKDGKEKNEYIGVRPVKLNRILQYVGFQNYHTFTDHLRKPIDDQLKSLEGNWYSIVRFNSRTEKLLLVSPVRIFEKRGEVVLELSGKNSVFTSKLKILNGNLFCLLGGSPDKQIHIVFRIGRRRGPEVLKGVFSGISTAGDPIGGRELLIRMENLPFEQLENIKISISDARNHDKKWLRKAAGYLEGFEENNLQIGQVNSFGLDDL